MKFSKAEIDAVIATSLRTTVWTRLGDSAAPHRAALSARRKPSLEVSRSVGS
jgi:hypothetical protein